MPKLLERSTKDVVTEFGNSDQSRGKLLTSNDTDREGILTPVLD